MPSVEYECPCMSPSSSFLVTNLKFLEYKDRIFNAVLAGKK